MNGTRKDWSNPVDDALWAYRTTYKTLLGMSTYQLIFGKSCHLPMELEHKAFWAINKLNFNFTKSGEARVPHLNELDEFRCEAYENSYLNKGRLKRFHDKMIKKMGFCPWDEVLLYNFQLSFFLGKLRSRWSGPFTISKILTNGLIQLKGKDGSTFVIKGQRVKSYYHRSKRVKCSSSTSSMLEPWRSRANDVKQKC